MLHARWFFFYFLFQIVNPFLANVPFLTPRKQWLTRGFLPFSKGKEREHWPEMGFNIRVIWLLCSLGFFFYPERYDLNVISGSIILERVWFQSRQENVTGKSQNERDVRFQYSIIRYICFSRSRLLSLSMYFAYIFCLKMTYSRTQRQSKMYIKHKTSTCILLIYVSTSQSQRTTLALQ